MAIDFTSSTNRRTYSGRDAAQDWFDGVACMVEPHGKRVIDLGCGGGVYSRAWLRAGADTVVAVDSSATILSAASEDSVPGMSTQLGDAAETGLPSGSADIVFARALVHHVSDVHAVAREAYRLLGPGGTIIVQDRTLADVDQAGSATHPRGWMFDIHPRLRDVESARRPTVAAVRHDLQKAGFSNVEARTVWETRRKYADREEYLAEIWGRIGRSILHELDDADLGPLVDQLRRRLPRGGLVEKDRWTVWSASV